MHIIIVWEIHPWKRIFGPFTKLIHEWLAPDGIYVCTLHPFASLAFTAISFWNFKNIIKKRALKPLISPFIASNLFHFSIWKEGTTGFTLYAVLVLCTGIVFVRISNRHLCFSHKPGKYRHFIERIKNFIFSCPN